MLNLDFQTLIIINKPVVLSIAAVRQPRLAVLKSILGALLKLLNSDI
jgi:hypothetical protein